MSLYTLFVFSIMVVFTTSTYVTKKQCTNVDTSICQVWSVDMEPCSKGARYCPVKTGKIYDVTVKFTPHFAANHLRYSILGDVQNTGGFDTVYTQSDDACLGIQCPVTPESTVEGHVPLILSKTNAGKFPVQVKVWNKNNTAEACCFTFNVKVFK